MSTEKKQNRVELLVESIAVQKQVIDEYCDDLITARDTSDKKGIKEAKKALDSQIKKYNNTVSEYNEVTGEKVELISATLPDEIEAGKVYRGIAPVGKTSSATSTTAYTSAVNVMNQKELAQYLAKSDKALDNVRARLAATVDRKNASNGYNKVLLIINCLTYQRFIVERLSENLAVCCQLSDNKKTKSFKALLIEEIRAYNKFVTEYEVITGSHLTKASETIPQCIIEGKPYPVIPAISYTANDGTVRNSDAEVAAVALAAAESVDNAKKKAKKAKKNKEIVQKTALDAKIAEQANKDVSVITKSCDFQISLLESDKDMTKYKFGESTNDIKKTKKAVDKKIAELKKNNKEALKLEAKDNERYYAVIKNDPGTMEIKKKKPNRTRIASLRTTMMGLLNKRDELNSKLLSIYNGTEVNIDGSSLNQTWRQVKSDAAEKSIKKNAKLAKEIERLPASKSEKQKLYSLVNENVDAASTKALCEYRLKKNEYVEKYEKKQLAQDAKDCAKLIKDNNEEINRAIKRIKKRG